FSSLCYNVRVTQTPVRRAAQPHLWPRLTVSQYAALINHDRLIMPRAQHRLLWALARANGRIITWVELHHALWPAEFYIWNPPMYSHLSRLRSQLRSALAKHNPDLEVPIRTIRKVGLELRWPPDRLHINDTQTPLAASPQSPAPDSETA
ncbi:unnamed protein product, partial [marine sediment metagenome]